MVRLVGGVQSVLQVGTLYMWMRVWTGNEDRLRIYAVASLTPSEFWAWNLSDLSTLCGVRVWESSLKYSLVVSHLATLTQQSSWTCFLGDFA